MRKAQQKTVLEIVNKIYLTIKGKGVPFPSTIETRLIKEALNWNKVEIIGHCTDYEKAIYLSSFNLAKRLLEDHDLDMHVENLMVHMHEALMTLLWSSIRFRLNSLKILEASMIINDDWQIIWVNRGWLENFSENILDKLDDKEDDFEEQVSETIININNNFSKSIEIELMLMKASGLIKEDGQNSLKEIRVSDRNSIKNTLKYSPYIFMS